LEELQKIGEMSVHASNILRRGGYQTLEEVMVVDEGKLRKLSGMGPHSMCEVRTVIKRYQEGEYEHR